MPIATEAIEPADFQREYPAHYKTLVGLRRVADGSDFVLFKDANDTDHIFFAMVPTEDDGIAVGMLGGPKSSLSWYGVEGNDPRQAVNQMFRVALAALTPKKE